MNPIPRTPIAHDCRILNQINELEFLCEVSAKTPGLSRLTIFDGCFAGYLRSWWRNLESANLNFGLPPIADFDFGALLHLYHLYETYDLCETFALCANLPSVKPIWAPSPALSSAPLAAFLPLESDLPSLEKMSACSLARRSSLFSVSLSAAHSAG